jgi:hypothetical protein
MDESFVLQNPELVLFLLTLFGSTLLGIFIYYVNKSDDNNKKQWATFTSHETRISKIEGRCDAIHSNGK